MNSRPNSPQSLFFKVLQAHWRHIQNNYNTLQVMLFIFFHLEYKSKICLIERHTLWFYTWNCILLTKNTKLYSQTSDPEKGKKTVWAILKTKFNVHMQGFPPWFLVFRISMPVNAASTSVVLPREIQYCQGFQGLRTQQRLYDDAGASTVK